MDLNDACLTLSRQLPDYRDRIIAVYAQMDAAYEAVAGHFGFVCDGCEDNCCRTRFRHHTLIEVAYLIEGFEALDSGLRHRVAEQARVYRRTLRDAEIRGRPFRHWCPLNQAGRCILYAHRPMICRLHGLPHIMRHPARGLIQGAGCHMFEIEGRNKAPRPLDRSGIYQDLARLEQTVRRASGWRAPISMTVADMLLATTEATEAVRRADGDG